MIFGRRRIDHVPTGEAETASITVAALPRPPRSKVVMAAHGADEGFACRPTLNGKPSDFCLRLATAFETRVGIEFGYQP